MPPIGRPAPPTPFWQTTDKVTCKVYLGDVLEVLRGLPSGSVHCVCSSPPYLGVRDYGLSPTKWPVVRYVPMVGVPEVEVSAQTVCFGLEVTPLEYVAHTVLIFRELRRVLRDDGVIWWNLGDSYSSQGGLSAGNENKGNDGAATRSLRNRSISSGNLQGVPQRVALALQADGWVWRSDLPWVKVCGMPESCDTRPNKSLESVFMFTKGMRYYFDMESVRQKCTSADDPRNSPDYQPKRAVGLGGDTVNDGRTRSSGPTTWPTGGRNWRQSDLWFESVDTPHGLTGVDDELVGLDVTTRGYPGAHYAVMPARLVEPLVKCGSSQHGVCGDCGSPWKRVVRITPSLHRPGRGYTANCTMRNDGDRPGTNQGGSTETLGWEPTCTCNGKFVTTTETRTVTRRKDDSDAHDRDHSTSTNRHGKGSCSLDPNVETEEVEKHIKVTRYVSDLPLDEHPVVPAVILDPFLGSGTVGVVAIELGRHSIGIDLSETYLRENAVPRISGLLMSRPCWHHLVPQTVKIVSLKGKIV